MKKLPSKEKAREMLHNPPHGKKLTEKQRKFFGYLANAQKGLSLYQEGGVIQDNEGYRNPDNIGKPVRINSNRISMKGIKQRLIGVSNLGEIQLLEPEMEYKFKGSNIIEFPVNNKRWLDKYE